MKRFIRNVQLASLSGLFVFGLTSAAMANTLFVPSQYAQIQDAINAAQEGDTVFVEPGTYDILSNIHMKEKVNLIGADNQSVILNGLIGGNEQSVISGANNSMLSGFKIVFEVPMPGLPNYGCAISLNHVRQMVIKNNIINGHLGEGISLYHSHFNILENNTIQSVEATKTIRDALSLSASSYNHILNNKLTGSYAGLLAMDANGNKIEHNLARRIPFSSEEIDGGAIFLAREQDTQLLNNTALDLTSHPLGYTTGGLVLTLPVNIQVNNCLIYGKKRGLYANGNGNPAQSVTIKYSDIKGDAQDALILGINFTYGEGVLFFPPKVNLVNGKISAASPCRNSGDPNTPNDPDESRSDMGAFYYTPDTVQPSQSKR